MTRTRDFTSRPCRDLIHIQCEGTRYRLGILVEYNSSKCHKKELERPFQGNSNSNLQSTSEEGDSYR
jgi:hypothetical protein